MPTMTFSSSRSAAYREDVAARGGSVPEQRRHRREHEGVMVLDLIHEEVRDKTSGTWDMCRYHMAEGRKRMAAGFVGTPYHLSRLA